jgi:hypothetical protein
MIYFCLGWNNMDMIARKLLQWSKRVSGKLVFQVLCIQHKPFKPKQSSLLIVESDSYPSVRAHSKWD